MNLSDITLPQEGIDWQNCAWLLRKNPEFNILLLTRFGEIFVTLDNGEVWFLSTSNASYEKAAESKGELSNLLSDENEVEYFFMPSVLNQLKTAGQNLENNECYGFRMPCVFEVDNFKPVQVENYLTTLGKVLGELQTAQDGESVEFKSAV